MLTLVDDHGLVVNAILWLLFCVSIIIICCALIQLVQLCFICHRLCNNTIYTPVYKAYKVYQNYMQIEPLPVLNV